MTRRSFAMIAVTAFASTVEIPSPLQASANWPLWEAYTARFLDRVAALSTATITTEPLPKRRLMLCFLR